MAQKPNIADDFAHGTFEDDKLFYQLFDQSNVLSALKSNSTKTTHINSTNTRVCDQIGQGSLDD